MNIPSSPLMIPNTTTDPATKNNTLLGKDLATRIRDGRLIEGKVINNAAAGPPPRPKDMKVWMIGISAAVGITKSIPAYEGYTVQNQAVSLLLDRAKLISNEKVTVPTVFQAVREKLGSVTIRTKENFAKRLNVPWYFVVYRDSENSVVLDMLDNGRELARFKTFKQLGEWTRGFREYVMKSRYEEDGLPMIDIKMRENDIPWPGNMDKALCINNEVVAIIEFQNTSKATVREHDNNKYFKPSYIEPPTTKVAGF